MINGRQNKSATGPVRPPATKRVTHPRWVDVAVAHVPRVKGHNSVAHELRHEDTARRSVPLAADNTQRQLVVGNEEIHIRVCARGREAMLQVADM